MFDISIAVIFEYYLLLMIPFIILADPFMSIFWIIFYLLLKYCDPTFEFLSEI